MRRSTVIYSLLPLGVAVAAACSSASGKTDTRPDIELFNFAGASSEASGGKGATGGSSGFFLGETAGASGGVSLPVKPGGPDPNCKVRETTGLFYGSSARFPCVLLADSRNQAICWGNQAFDGANVLSVAFNMPVNGIVAVAPMASLKGCLITQLRRVQCWDETGYVSNAPVATGARSFSVGSNHGCAVSEVAGKNRVVCWGQNGSGQRGNGSSGNTGIKEDIANQVGLPDTDNPLQVAAGGSTSCVLLEGGAVKCWGSNPGPSGARFMGATTTDAIVTTPIEVAAFGNESVIDLQLGSQHACARLMSGAVKCWGVNTDGRVDGNGRFEARLADPFMVAAPGFTYSEGGTLALSVGNTHTCIIKDDKHVKCSGGTFTEVDFKAIAAVEDAVSIASGDNIVCILDNAANVRCIGQGTVERGGIIGRVPELCE